METTKWLKQTASGFGTLSAKERKAIKDFALLWSFFEGTVLSNNANADSIIRSTETLRTRNNLNLVPFRSAISHFCKRYHNGRDFTHEFNALNLRSNDRIDVVKAFIDQSTADEVQILSGLLITVFRLRNNLFHGIKWAYGIQGQYENFRHANLALMATMELHR